MGRTLRDDMASDVTNTFLDVQTGFAEIIAFNPGGDFTAAQQIPAIVDLTDERQDQGDKIEDHEGRRAKRFGRITISNVVGTNQRKLALDVDTFTIAGEVWWLTRIESRDTFAGGMQTLIISRSDQVTTRQTRLHK